MNQQITGSITAQNNATFNTLAISSTSNFTLAAAQTVTVVVNGDGLNEADETFFVNVTNDSWFGAPAEPYQHLCMTLARGVEFRRPVVRATNTGISAAMRAWIAMTSRAAPV